MTRPAITIPIGVQSWAQVNPALDAPARKLIEKADALLRANPPTPMENPLEWAATAIGWGPVKAGFAKGRKIAAAQREMVDSTERSRVALTNAEDALRNLGIDATMEGKAPDIAKAALAYTTAKADYEARKMASSALGGYDYSAAMATDALESVSTDDAMLAWTAGRVYASRVREATDGKITKQNRNHYEFGMALMDKIAGPRASWVLTARPDAADRAYMRGMLEVITEVGSFAYLDGPATVDPYAA
jgi:hypothetical protein